MEPDDIQQPAQEQAPPEWGTTDEIRKAQYDAAEGSANDALENDQITPDQHKELMGQIQPKKQAMQARKQAAMQYQMQQQQQMAMHQNAHAVAMKQQDAEYEAQNANKRKIEFYDPMTGGSAHYVKNDKGGFDKIEYDNPAGEEGENSDMSDSGQLDNFSPTLGMVPGEQDKPSPWAGFDMDTSKVRNTQMGGGPAINMPPSRQQPQTNEFGGILNHGELQELWRRAHMGAKNQNQVVNNFHNLIEKHEKIKQAQLNRQSSMDAAAAKANQARQDKLEAKQEKEVDRMHTHYNEAYDKSLKDIQAEHKEWSKSFDDAQKARLAAGKDNATDEVKDDAKRKMQGYMDRGKDYFESPETMEQEALKRAQRRMRNVHGWTDEHFKKIGAPVPREEQPAQDAPKQAGSTTDQRVAPGGFKDSPSQQADVAKEHKETLGRIGMAPDGKTLNLAGAATDDLQKLHAQMEDHQKYGVKPEIAKGVQAKIQDVLRKRKEIAEKAKISREGKPWKAEDETPEERNAPIGAGYAM